jgi:hypothetical protein
MSLAIQVVGLQAMQANLRQLGQAIERKHMRIAFNAGGGVMKRDAAPRIQRDTGAYSKSLAVRVTNRKKGGWAAVVGASRKAKWKEWQTKTGKLKVSRVRGNPLAVFGDKFKKPSRYAHFAEKKNPAMARAASAAGPAAGQKIVSKLVEGLQIETAKLRVR